METVDLLEIIIFRLIFVFVEIVNRHDKLKYFTLPPNAGFKTFYHTRFFGIRPGVERDSSLFRPSRSTSVS